MGIKNKMEKNLCATSVLGQMCARYKCVIIIIKHTTSKQTFDDFCSLLQVFEDVVDILDPEMNLGSDIDEEDEFREELSYGTEQKAEDNDRSSTKSSTK